MTCLSALESNSEVEVVVADVVIFVVGAIVREEIFEYMSNIMNESFLSSTMIMSRTHGGSSGRILRDAANG